MNPILFIISLWYIIHMATWFRRIYHKIMRLALLTMMHQVCTWLIHGWQCTMQLWGICLYACVDGTNNIKCGHHRELNNSGVILFIMTIGIELPGLKKKHITKIVFFNSTINARMENPINSTDRVIFEDQC